MTEFSITMLTTRERAVIALWYGLGFGRSRNPEEIGLIVSTLPKRVCRIKAEVMEMLGHPDRATLEKLFFPKGLTDAVPQGTGCR